MYDFGMDTYHRLFDKSYDYDETEVYQVSGWVSGWVKMVAVGSRSNRDSRAARRRGGYNSRWLTRTNTNQPRTI